MLVEFALNEYDRIHEYVQTQHELSLDVNASCRIYANFDFIIRPSVVLTKASRSRNEFDEWEYKRGTKCSLVNAWVHMFLLMLKSH